MYSLTNGIVKYLDVTPIIVSAGIKTGIKIVTENPKEIGPDRIVDAVAAYGKYGGPVIVLDFGTATTYDLVGANGTFEAGITAPGIETSGRSLWVEQPCSRQLRSKSRNPFLQKRRSAVCRRDWSMEPLGRQNIL